MSRIVTPKYVGDSLKVHARFVSVPDGEPVVPDDVTAVVVVPGPSTVALTPIVSTDDDGYTVADVQFDTTEETGVGEYRIGITGTGAEVVTERMVFDVQAV